MLWTFWKCKVFPESISNKGHFSLLQEIGYLAWWLGFIENLVARPPQPPTHGAPSGTLGDLKEPFHHVCHWGRNFQGAATVPAHSLPRLAWRGLLYVLSYLFWRGERLQSSLWERERLGCEKARSQERGSDTDACWLYLQAAPLPENLERFCGRGRCWELSLCHFWCDEAWSVGYS